MDLRNLGPGAFRVLREGRDVFVYTAGRPALVLTLDQLDALVAAARGRAEETAGPHANEAREVGVLGGTRR